MSIGTPGNGFSVGHNLGVHEGDSENYSPKDFNVSLLITEKLTSDSFSVLIHLSSNHENIAYSHNYGVFYI